MNHNPSNLKVGDIVMLDNTIMCQIEEITPMSVFCKVSRPDTTTLLEVMTNRLSKMTYREAIQESLKVKWVMSTCPQGEECWCRTVKCESPLLYQDGDSKEEFYVIRAGEVGKDIVEHIVNLQNKSLELPSDDEIYEASFFKDGSDYSLGEHSGFIEGAKWMKEQITKTK